MVGDRRYFSIYFGTFAEGGTEISERAFEESISIALGVEKGSLVL